jgi:hypothetical protein
VNPYTPLPRCLVLSVFWLSGERQVSNWLVAIVGGTVATVVGGVVLFYLLPSQQTPALSLAGPKYLSCTLMGGVFQGQMTFSLDLRSKKANWQGLPLEITRVTGSPTNTLMSPRRFGLMGTPFPHMIEWCLSSIGSIWRCTHT